MKRNQIVWTALSIVLAIASVVLVVFQSQNFSITELRVQIMHANKFYLSLALIAMFLFIYLEGKALLRISRSLGYQKSTSQGLMYSAADVYFSAITPSASGGQPASAYFMLKDGFQSSAIVTILLLNLILYSVSLLIIAVLAFLFFGKILVDVSFTFKLLFILGIVVLLVLALLFFLLLKSGEMLYRAYDKILVFFEKRRWVKKGEEKREKFRLSVDRYKECAAIISRDKAMLREALLYDLLQRLSQLSVSFFIFMAMGMDVYVSMQAMAIYGFVAVASHSVPVPGGMGVADLFMLDGFSKLVGRGAAANLALMCRGVAFYFCVLTGGLITFVSYVRRRRKSNAGIL